MRNIARKLFVAATVATGTVMAHAAGSGADAALDAVDLSGISTKVGAAALLIVGIALVFKGPDLAKRVVRKV